MKRTELIERIESNAAVIGNSISREIKTEKFRLERITRILDLNLVSVDKDALSINWENIDEDFGSESMVVYQLPNFYNDRKDVKDFQVPYDELPPLDWEKEVFALELLGSFSSGVYYSNELLILIQIIFKYTLTLLKQEQFFKLDYQEHEIDIMSKSYIAEYLLDKVEHNQLKRSVFYKKIKSILPESSDELKYIGSMKDFYYYRYLFSSEQRTGKLLKKLYFENEEFFPWTMDFTNKEERDLLLKFLPSSQM